MSRIPVRVLASITPNPHTMKFITTVKIIEGTQTAEFKTVEEAKGFSSMAEALFQFSYVKEVFMAGNFISITKDEFTSWDFITMDLRDFIRNYLMEQKPIIHCIPDEIDEPEWSPEVYDSKHYTNSEFDDLIQKLFEREVNPITQKDGGTIVFRNYIDGVVTVLLKGACSECPAANKTMKNGIEKILKRHIPEVKSVVAENGDFLKKLKLDEVNIESSFL